MNRNCLGALALSMALVHLTGCAGRHQPQNSFVGNLPREQAAIEKIAKDAASCLAELYPPGHTTVHLVPAKSRDTFRKAFETDLRSKGFTLASPGALVTARYVLDELRVRHALSWYLHLRLEDSKGVRVMNRSYMADGQAEAGFSSTVQ